MKNIRKIVAILAAVLMLCSVLPLGALSVAADVSFDFEDGTVNGWASDCGVETVDLDGAKVLKWDASGAAWANMYNYCNLAANTEYVLTLKVKADRDTNMNFKVLKGDWTATTYQTTFDVTTEWQEVTVQFNSGEGSFVMLSSNADAGAGATYYVDSFAIAEYVAPAVPGQIVNGDFETGDTTGWNLPQQGGVSAEAAHDGSYGVNIKGNGGWGGMLDQTIPVNAGKAYEITFWLQINATGVNIQIKDGDTSGANIAGEWVDMNKAGSWTQFTYVVRPTQDALTINFCGSGSAAEDAYVDSFTCTELVDPSFDGYITNGTFETGATDSWDPLWWAGNISLVEGGHNSDYAMQVNHGQYQLVRQVVNVEPNTDYVVQCYAKNVNNMTLLAKSYPADANIAQAGMSGGDNWTQNSLVFNSGDCTQVYICVMGNVAGSTAIVDDFFMFEKVEESNDGYIINGTFETGALTPWNNLWGSCPKAEIVRGGKDSTFALEIISGQWKHVRQTNIAVEANTDYKITAWAKNASGMSLLVKDGSDSADIVNAGVSAGDEWTEFTAEFNTGDFTTIIFSLMGNQEEAYGIFDNIVMEKIVCEHEYFTPCDQYCMICGELTNPEASHNIVHVEAVEPTCTEMGNLEYWYCDVCGQAWLDEACTLNTNLMAVKLPMADHTYDDCSDLECNVCGETREFGHNMTHNPAKDAIDCANPGNIENWFCSACGEYFADEFGNEILNPWYINVTVDCVRPEGVADCADWTCEICGNENYGYGEHDTGVPACQDGHCSKCDQDIAGYGCANYDTPACEDGVCYYCGGFVAGLGHENGAWAPCLEGECSYGCGLTYPATADHVDEDGDDYCDTCWNHLACIDEDGDNFCDVCWSEMPQAPVEILYGDADGDGEITLLDAGVLSQYLGGYEVDIDLVAADADGDGEVTLLDAGVLSQYLGGYDVTLGPAPV